MLSVTLLLGYGVCSGKTKEDASEKGLLKYSGKFKWNRKGKDEFDVRGTFKKKEDGTYDAKFYFKWGKTPHIYTGIVTGDMEKGPIKGKIYNDNKKREFALQCEYKDGKFTGTHQEIRRKKPKETGLIYFSKDS